MDSSVPLRGRDGEGGQNKKRQVTGLPRASPRSDEKDFLDSQEAVIARKNLLYRHLCKLKYNHEKIKERK